MAVTGGFRTQNRPYILDGRFSHDEEEGFFVVWVDGVNTLLKLKIQFDSYHKANICTKTTLPNLLVDSHSLRKPSTKYTPTAPIIFTDTGV